MKVDCKRYLLWSVYIRQPDDHSCFCIRQRRHYLQLFKSDRHFRYINWSREILTQFFPELFKISGIATVMSIFCVLFSVPNHIYFSKYTFRQLPIIITQDSERLLVITGYISIVRNADIFIKSYKSNISESQKSAFLKYRHMGDRNFFSLS